jgi:hypothetical protein
MAHDVHRHEITLQDGHTARAAQWTNGQRWDVVPRSKGDETLTHYDEERLPRLLATCVIGLLLMATCMFHYLPRQFAMIAICWMMLSIPVGISFGHAVLNEP